MKRKQVDKYVGLEVALTFTHSWFNEAVQSWVNEEEEYVGILKTYEYSEKRHYYELVSSQCLPTDKSCFSANRIKKIRIRNRWC